MISQDDIDAMNPQLIDEAGAQIRRDLKRIEKTPLHREFTATGLEAFLRCVVIREAYIDLLEAGMNAAGDMAADMVRLQRDSMGLHEGPSKPSQM